MQSYKLFGTTRLARGFHITKKAAAIVRQMIKRAPPREPGIKKKLMVQSVSVGVSPANTSAEAAAA